MRVRRISVKYFGGKVAAIEVNSDMEDVDCRGGDH